MQISPATPTGAGDMNTAPDAGGPTGLTPMTYTRVLAMGVPIEVTCGCATRAAVDHTVVSVGPYTLNAAPVHPSRSSASSDGSASPPTSAVSAGSPGHPPPPPKPAAASPLSPPGLLGAANAGARSILQVVGVACIMLMRCSFSSPASSAGSAAVASDASTRVAPTQAGRNSSSAAMSKHTVVTAHSRVDALAPVSSSMDPRKFIRLRCVTCTPLGRPVEPEVKSTYARSLGCPTGSGMSLGEEGAAGASVSSIGRCAWRAFLKCPAGTSSSASAFASACARRAASAMRASSPPAADVMTAETPASCIMAPTRSAGYSGSSGRYAARVICTASSAASISGPRSRYTPTTRPRRSPPWAAARTDSARRSRALSLFSSAYTSAVSSPASARARAARRR
mmetsp:Transcript_15674/g.38040  ORF Transcript_15674/g.38040 Transcript_15674/m.38040 type:complete len:396 (+) Transcript_15674:424-1611(+)